MTIFTPTVIKRPDSLVVEWRTWDWKVAGSNPKEALSKKILKSEIYKKDSLKMMKHNIYVWINITNEYINIYKNEIIQIKYKQKQK